MSPIEGISDIKRLPRLGKIRLGEKKQGQKGPYPAATEHFICPEEVKAVFGSKPTELKVMFPANDLDLVAPQWYKCYSYSQGLICKGNGKTCRRKVDTDRGDFADKDTKQWELMEAICNPDGCPMLAEKQCRKCMSLFFILPDVPGLGVYQLDTGSFYSIVNINSQLAEGGFLRPFTRGKIAFIPLILSLGPQVVNPPGEGRKTVRVLSIRADIKPADLIRISRQSPAQVLLPAVEQEEPPEDLYPDEVIGGPGSESESQSASHDATHEVTHDAEQPRESVKPPRAPAACGCPKPVPQDEVSMAEDGTVWHSKCKGYLCTPPIDCFPGCPHMPPARGEGQAISSPPKVKAAPSGTKLPASPGQVAREDVPDWNALCRLCFHFWDMQPQGVCKELGHVSQMDAYNHYTAHPEQLWAAWLTIVNLKTAQPPR